MMTLVPSVISASSVIRIPHGDGLKLSVGPLIHDLVYEHCCRCHSHRFLSANGGCLTMK